MYETDLNITKTEFERILDFSCQIFPEFNKEYNKMSSSMPYLIEQKYKKFEEFNFLDLDARAGLANGYGPSKIFILNIKNKTYKLEIRKLNKTMLRNLHRKSDFAVAILTIQDEDIFEEKMIYINLKKKDEKTCCVERSLIVTNTNTFKANETNQDNVILSFKDVEEIFGSDKTQNLSV